MIASVRGWGFFWKDGDVWVEPEPGDQAFDTPVLVIPLTADNIEAMQKQLVDLTDFDGPGAYGRAREVLTALGITEE